MTIKNKKSIDLTAGREAELTAGWEAEAKAASARRKKHNGWGEQGHAGARPNLRPRQPNWAALTRY